MSGNSRVGSTKRDYERAIEICDAELSSLDVKDKKMASKVFHKRAVLKRKHAEFSKALADMNKSLEINPEDAAALANRGGLKRRVGDYHGAVADFTESMKKLDKTSETEQQKHKLGSREMTILREVLIGRAAARHSMGKISEAAMDVNRAISYGQKSPFTLQLSGDLQRKLGKCGSAVSDYDAALQLMPSFVPALVGRAAAQRTLGRYEEAIKDFDAAVTLSPLDANLLADRGFTKYKMRLADDAQDDFLEALKIDADNKLARWGLNELEAENYSMTGPQYPVLLWRSVIIHGFKREGLNTRYVERRDGKHLVNFRETWWAEDWDHFFYWSEAEHRWKASLSAHLKKIRAGSKASIASAPVDAPFLDDESLTNKKWYEWDGLEWQAQNSVCVSVAGPASDQRRVITLGGFHGQTLNGEYDELREPKFCVNYRETYWSADREYFLFWEEKRWKGSHKRDFAKIVDPNGKSTAVIAAPSRQDLFRCPLLVGWREYNSVTNDWPQIEDAGVFGVSSEHPVKAMTQAS